MKQRKKKTQFSRRPTGAAETLHCRTGAKGGGISLCVRHFRPPGWYEIQFRHIPRIIFQKQFSSNFRKKIGPGIGRNKLKSRPRGWYHEIRAMSNTKTYSTTTLIVNITIIFYLEILKKRLGQTIIIRHLHYFRLHCEMVQPAYTMRAGREI